MIYNCNVLQFNYVKNVPEEIKCCKPSNYLLAYHSNIIRENPLKMYAERINPSSQRCKNITIERLIQLTVLVGRICTDMEKSIKPQLGQLESSC